MKTPGIQDEIEYHIILFLKQDCNNKIIREICKSKAFKGSSNGVLIDNFKEHVLDLYSQSGTSSAGQMQSCLVQTAVFKSSIDIRGGLSSKAEAWVQC